MKDDLEGATFSMYQAWVHLEVGFSPIINPPEVGIIGYQELNSL